MTEAFAKFLPYYPRRRGLNARASQLSTIFGDGRLSRPRNRRRFFELNRRYWQLRSDYEAATNADDPLNDPRYQAFLAETAKTCRAREKPCPGCCSGGMCDGHLGGYFAEESDDDFDDDLLISDEEDQATMPGCWAQEQRKDEL